MKNFDEIIKQKIEQFEVPFNDAHWSGMEARLNKVNSKQNKKLFFGSTATIITLIITAYFLFPSTPTTTTTTTTTLNSKAKIPVKESSNSSNSSIVQSSVSVSKKKVAKEVLTDEKITSKTTPHKTNTITKKASITSSKTIVKTKKQKAPVIKVEETTISEIIQQEEPSIIENNLELSPLKLATIEDSVTANPAKEIISSPDVEKATAAVINFSKNKNDRYKSYKDENISKKSVKRSRRRFFSFLNFKKKRYKVPLSKKKSSRPKKKK